MSLSQRDAPATHKSWYYNARNGHCSWRFAQLGHVSRYGATFAIMAFGRKVVIWQDKEIIGLLFGPLCVTLRPSRFVSYMLLSCVRFDRGSGFCV